MSKRIDVSKLSPTELYRLKDELAEILIFGPWTKKDEGCFGRPEPGLADRYRVSVWHCSGPPDSDLEAGWYYRIGFCVVGIGGVTGTTPFPSAEDCMKAADSALAGVPDLYLV